MFFYIPSPNSRLTILASNWFTVDVRLFTDVVKLETLVFVVPRDKVKFETLVFVVPIEFVTVVEKLALFPRAAASSLRVLRAVGAPSIKLPSWLIGTLPSASRVAIPSAFPTSLCRA